MMARVVIVGAVRGLDQLTYEVPARLANQLRPGHRVLVPLRSRRVTAIVTEIGESLDSGGASLQPIVELLESRPLFDRPHLQLIEFLASYYMASLGEAFRSVLPSLARVESRRVYRIANAPHALARAALNSLEKKIIDALEKRAMTFRQLARLAEREAIKEALDRLQAEGWITTREATRGRHRALARDEGTSCDASERGDSQADSGSRVTFDATQEIELSGEQAAAVAAATPAIVHHYFEPFLLLGVTASGKTEVYLRLTAEALKSNQQVLVLVPEIVLADQLVRSFRARFGELVAVAHSGQNIGERWASLMAALEGAARIMIGPRSAIFSPINALGLIVVDEEHDAAYKQEEGIRYHARDLAVALARFANCPVVLGSATPSVESYANARRGRYRLLQLTRRIQQRELAPVEIIDLRQHRVVPAKPHSAPGNSEAVRQASSPAPAHEDDWGRLASLCSIKKGRQALHSDAASAESLVDDLPLSPPLIRALRDNLATAGQSLLFLNRRGYHNFLQCRFCGSVITCRNCSVSMTFHWQGRMLRCHYCGAAEPAPDKCFDCGGFGLEGQGYGTERLVHALARLFPSARIARVDSDTSGRRGARNAILHGVEAGHIDILVGTQMITKGLNFPNITLVAVVLADLSLNMPDFRSAERTFQLLTQAAGRAGRGTRPGRVLIQTYAPHHYSIRAARDQDYARFIAREMKLRRELLYPPFAQMALVRIEGSDAAYVRQHATRIAQQISARSKPETMRVLGPAPAPIERIKQRYRWQILVKAQERSDLRAALLPALSNRALDGIRVSVDIDPVSML